MTMKRILDEQLRRPRLKPDPSPHMVGEFVANYTMPTVDEIQALDAEMEKVLADSIPIDVVATFAAELRKWWSFDDRQQHTHSWHSREDFIEKRLPRLLIEARRVR